MPMAFDPEAKPGLANASHSETFKHRTHREALSFDVRIGNHTTNGNSEEPATREGFGTSILKPDVLGLVRSHWMEPSSLPTTCGRLEAQPNAGL